MNRKIYLAWMGLFLSVFLFMQPVMAQRDKQSVQNVSVKYQYLMALVDAYYVDSVDLNRLTEFAITKALSELDPHSVYVSKEKVRAMNESLSGVFGGIGIEFSMLEDELVVVGVLPDSPAEKAGMYAGDRIVKIDGKKVEGGGMSVEEVQNCLKGERETEVFVIVRRGNKLSNIRIIRDKVPLYSIPVFYMLDATTGYVKIMRFAATTIEEFEHAVQSLCAAGMKDLIVDLQGNGGGYIGAAIGVADNLLKESCKIVYTDGVSAVQRSEYATSAGIFEDGRVLFLIDENTASASEIVSGAVQDWDRGVIVGRRSFGKGLVQRQYPLPDSSVVRLTISHYYTPSGRCIQRPYKQGNEAYAADFYRRYTSGELLNADSVSVNDSLKYYTKLKHRLVYGGGGIIPDVFVALDTQVDYRYFNRLATLNVLRNYVIVYLDEWRSKLKKEYKDFDKFNCEFEVTDEMVEIMVGMGEKSGVQRDDFGLYSALSFIKLQLKALIARDLWGESAMYRVLNIENKMLKEGIRILDDGSYERLLKLSE